MTNRQISGQRPLAFEDGKLYWNLQHVPDKLTDGKTSHPGRCCAVFVVHGMGEQRWTQTSAELRAGFEDALEDILAWQKENLQKKPASGKITIPPPFVFDGFWANYSDIKETFPDDWKRFNERERKFFANLWKQRIVSGTRTLQWMLRQQLRLLHPKVVHEVGLSAWLLYWPLQVVSTASLLFAWVRYPKAITGTINDVRLYVDPKGVAERAIVQRIDERVTEQFLRMIGLDREFRRLPDDQLLEVGGDHLSFKRVIWVAHSLGTVVSYNALSALFHKAEAIDANGDNEQKEGVKKFRGALSRFVTMGSPLDKIAFLFGTKSLRPWPPGNRRALLCSGENLISPDPDKTEWWINFYHVWDPVSGSLESPFICGDNPPSNVHIRSGWIPGLAHLSYWSDRTTLRFILGRTFGSKYLKDREFRPWPVKVQGALAVVGYVTWASLLFSAVYAIYHWGPDLLRGVGEVALKWVTG